jgi:hypothetical protein
MNPLMLTIALTLPTIGQQTAQPAKEPPPKVIIDDELSPLRRINGNWTVHYAEINGKIADSKLFTDFVIKNNHVVCRHDGRERSWRLEFGPRNTVRCVERIDGKATTELLEDKGDGIQAMQTHHGVYIVSREFFCLYLKEGIDARLSTAPEVQVLPVEVKPKADAPPREIPKDANPKADAPPRVVQPEDESHRLVIILRRPSLPVLPKQ